MNITRPDIEGKTLEQCKQSLAEALRKLRIYINTHTTFEHLSEETTKNLCEAYLDEWYTHEQVRKNSAKGIDA